MAWSVGPRSTNSTPCTYRLPCCDGPALGGFTLRMTAWALIWTSRSPDWTTNANETSILSPTAPSGTSDSIRPPATLRLVSETASVWGDSPVGDRVAWARRSTLTRIALRSVVPLTACGNFRYRQGNGLTEIRSTNVANEN